MSERLLLPEAQLKSPLGSKKRKRATNACLRCRLKKQRCDGISQPCGNCAKSSTECVFPDEIVGEKFLRQHIANLEARVREISSALKEIEPGHSVLKATDAEVLSEQDLVDGLGFLSLTSGAEPLALCNQTGEAHFFPDSLIPPRTSLSSSGESLGTNSIPSHDWTPSSDADCSVFQPNFSMQLKPGFIFPPFPQDDHLSDELFAAVFTTIQARHCFMNFVILKKWCNERKKYCESEQPLVGDRPRTAAFFLWLTFALGLRLWEMRGRVIPGLPSHEYYFQAALQYYDHVSSNTTTIQALLFLAMYSFRSTKGLSTWHLTGLAMRSALELGLHRKTPKAQQLSHLHEETKKRIWWSVYALERTMAFQLGRPIAIQDDEIDTELPLDIDCHITDDEQIVARRVAVDKKLSETGTTLESSPYPLGFTTMSPSLHHIRLRKIMTRIKMTVYNSRFSKENKEQRCANVDAIALELDQWRAHIPAKINLETQSDTDSGWDLGGIPFYTGEWFELQYLNAVQSLLIPIALRAPPGNPYLHRAALAAMTACELQRKRLQKDSMAPLAVYSLHKLFMSGVFMLFALDKDPSLSVAPDDLCTKSSMDQPGLQEHNTSFDNCSASHNGISPKVFLQVKNCQEALSIYALHYPPAKPYAHCFENMSNTWLRKFDRRDSRQELLAQRHLNPDRTSENGSDANTAFIHRSSDHRFKPSFPPTLWKDDLNLPGRMRSSVEGSATLCSDGSLFQPGPHPYHLLSLGPVEPNCEPFQLLKSEEERYQFQKPWMLGRIEPVCPKDFLGNTSQPPGPKVSKSISPYSSEVDIPTTTLSDGVGSLLPSGFMDNSSQSVQNLLDNHAKRSDRSSWNDVFSDQNFNNSSNPSREVPQLEPTRSYRINSAVSLSFSDNEWCSTKFPEDVAEKLRRKQSSMSQNSYLGEEITSKCNSGVDSLPSLPTNKQRRTSIFKGDALPISDDRACFTLDLLYDKSQINESSSNAWSGVVSEFAGNANDLSSMAGVQVPDIEYGNGQPIEAHLKKDEFSPVSLCLSEESVQNKRLDPTHPGSPLQSCGQRDIQNCIELLLSGPGDYNKLVHDHYSEYPINLMTNAQGNSGNMVEPGNCEMCEGSGSTDPSLFQAPVNGYRYTLG